MGKAGVRHINQDVRAVVLLLLEEAVDGWATAASVTEAAITSGLYKLPKSRTATNHRSASSLATELWTSYLHGDVVRVHGRDTRAGHDHRLCWHYSLTKKRMPIPAWLSVATVQPLNGSKLPKAAASEDEIVEAAAQQQAEAQFIESSAKKRAEVLKARIDARAKQLLADMLKGV